MKYNILFAAVLISAALSGCSSVDYRSKAVERARRYALNHTSQLSEKQRDYIRYNKPVIMQSVVRAYNPIVLPEHDHIMTRFSKDRVKGRHHDLMQQCMVWNVPDLAGSLMVVGTGERSFMFWEPEELLVKQFHPHDPVKNAARLRAIEFALDTFKNLTDDEIDTVRFADPLIKRTNYALPYKEPEIKPDGNNWMQYLYTAAKKEPDQYSVIWTPEKSKRNIAVAGLAEDNNLQNWKPVKVFILDSDGKVVK